MCIQYQKKGAAKGEFNVWTFKLFKFPEMLWDIWTVRSYNNCNLIRLFPMRPHARKCVRILSWHGNSKFIEIMSWWILFNTNKYRQMSNIAIYDICAVSQNPDGCILYNLTRWRELHRRNFVNSIYTYTFFRSFSFISNPYCLFDGTTFQMAHFKRWTNPALMD